MTPYALKRHPLSLALLIGLGPSFQAARLKIQFRPEQLNEVKPAAQPDSPRERNVERPRVNSMKARSR